MAINLTDGTLNSNQIIRNDVDYRIASLRLEIFNLSCKKWDALAALNIGLCIIWLAVIAIERVNELS